MYMYKSLLKKLVFIVSKKNDAPQKSLKTTLHLKF